MLDLEKKKYKEGNESFPYVYQKRNSLLILNIASLAFF